MGLLYIWLKKYVTFVIDPVVMEKNNMSLNSMLNNYEKLISRIINNDADSQQKSKILRFITKIFSPLEYNTLYKISSLTSFFLSQAESYSVDIQKCLTSLSIAMLGFSDLFSENNEFIVCLSSEEKISIYGKILALRDLIHLLGVTQIPLLASKRYLSLLQRSR
jgi:hypothetical protein